MNRIERMVLLWGAIAAALVGDLLLPILMSHAPLQSRLGEFLAPFMVGLVLAQVASVAIWCALAQQPASIRLPLSLVLILLGGGLFLTGITMSQGSVGNKLLFELVFMFGLIPFTAIQGPLWMVRWLTARRIMLVDNGPAIGTFSIRYLLMLTAVVAMIVAMYRMHLGDSSITFKLAQLLEFLAVGGATSLYVAALTYPCIWLVLSDQPAIRLSAAILLFISWMACPLISAMCVVALNGGNGTLYNLAFLLCFGLGVVGGTLVGLYVLRNAGYRLLKPVQNHPSDASGE